VELEQRFNREGSLVDRSAGIAACAEALGHRESVSVSGWTSAASSQASGHETRASSTARTE